MNITHIETIPIQIQKKESLAIVSSLGANRKSSTFVIVKIFTDEGIIGLGEVSCDPIWSGEDHVTSSHYIKNVFTPLLRGEDPTEVERLTIKISNAIIGNPFTKSAIEMALWDILGKSVGLPLYRLLGGPIRDFVPTKFSVSGTEPKKAAEIASWAVSIGFQAMKVKVGLEPETDILRVRAVREAIGEKIKLGVDANGGWSPNTAVQTIHRLSEFNIQFVEQPVSPLDVAWLADVRSQVNLPIMADESVFNLQDAMTVVKAKAADIISVYVGKGGGLGSARKIAVVSEAAGLTCTVGSNMEMGIASSAMIHLAMSTPSINSSQIPCDIIGPLYYEDSILCQNLPIKGGEARPLELPGLGVELDENKVDHYRIE